MDEPTGAQHEVCFGRAEQVVRAGELSPSGALTSSDQSRCDPPTSCEYNRNLFSPTFEHLPKARPHPWSACTTSTTLLQRRS